MQVLCPRCRKISEFSSENKFRPFCSERCKMIDLGAWANDAYKIESKEPATLSDDELNSLEHNDNSES